MAPTREELLAYLRQARADAPLLTKDELAALALARFAGGRDAASPETEQPAGQIETALKIPAASEQLLDAQQLLLLIEELSLPEQIENAADQSAARPEPQPPVWPVVNRRLVYKTVLLGVLFAVVIAAAYRYGLDTAPPTEAEPAVAAVAAVRTAVPDETGDVSRFGKRFAGNSSYYDTKYRGKILEMVGIVDSVERSENGRIHVTLLLADQKNSVMRARFQFMPDQTEAISLAQGTMAVIKGRYSRYQDKVIDLFPASVVYNGAQEE
ncbi:MAG: hypothetical protein E6X17_12715 [Sporomusaceae bacterium]|nr:hypothetical protein [Sporomusaceae bacterium]